MTTILAVQYKNGFVIAADGQVTENERPFFHKGMPKIVSVGDYVIAGAGVSRFCDVILYAWQPPVYDGSEIYKFMVSQFIPSMRKAHEEAGCVLKDDDSFKFVVGVENELFYIAEDYSVLRSDSGFYGAGTGYAYGIGALSAGASIDNAMKISIKFDINSGGKVQIVKQGV